MRKSTVLNQALRDGAWFAYVTALAICTLFAKLGAPEGPEKGPAVKTEEAKKQEEQEKLKAQEAAETAAQVAATARAEEQAQAAAHAKAASEWARLTAEARTKMIDDMLGRLVSHTLTAETIRGLAPELVGEMLRKDPKKFFEELKKQDLFGALEVAHFTSITDVLKDELKKSSVDEVRLDAFMAYADDFASSALDEQPALKKLLDQAVFDASMAYLRKKFEGGPGAWGGYEGTEKMIMRLADLRTRVSMLDETRAKALNEFISQTFLGQERYRTALLNAVTSHIATMMNNGTAEKLTSAFLSAATLASLAGVNSAFQKDVIEGFLAQFKQLDVTKRADFITLTRQKIIGRVKSQSREPNVIGAFKDVFALAMAMKPVDPMLKKNAFDTAIDFLAKISTRTGGEYLERIDIQNALIPEKTDPSQLFTPDVLANADSDSLKKLSSVIDLVSNERVLMRRFATRALEALKKSLDSKSTWSLSLPDLVLIFRKIFRYLGSWTAEEKIAVRFKNLLDDMASAGVSIKPEDYYDRFYKQFADFNKELAAHEADAEARDKELREKFEKSQSVTEISQQQVSPGSVVQAPAKTSVSTPSPAVSSVAGGSAPIGTGTASPVVAGEGPSAARSAGAPGGQPATGAGTASIRVSTIS